MVRFLPFLAFALCTSAAPTAYATPQVQAKTKSERAVVKLVSARLLKPMKKQEKRRSMFSRASLPPSERRVRVQEASRLDAEGKRYHQFFVDSRFRRASGDWIRDDMVGCVYINSGKVFVQMGDDFHPVKAFLGKEEPAPSKGSCHTPNQPAPKTASPPAKNDPIFSQDILKQLQNPGDGLPANRS